ncbi:alanine--tRNA ligase [Conexibacter sp. DBS9H8]|uniref:alanine--tRNA ligase n=1 Tax=Conexibacter sp. DBS9H8 TaxID=2937801 RepID=UPI00200D064F|nr:alanine--tRNA ligase [Conexibacter sp. DBS9H8]
MAMSSDEIRTTFLDFFVQHDHRAQDGASLIPPASDTSALFIVAGMHPLKAYFAGTEAPPAPRLTTCQPSFRTGDIENVGVTARHLTLFEMLGNFSFGDYFKREAIRFAWDLSREGFGLNGDDIWVTVFGGDERLGLGPDEEAIGYWLEVGMPRERIIELPREENFWESGTTGPCGPDSELYLDRGVAFGSADDLPGGENARFLEFWNLVFMQFNQDPPNAVTPLPAQNIDTGMGLNRMAAILQGKETVFETDQFRPLIDLGEELSGRRYESGDPAVDRALRLLADHSRAMTFLIAEGVVPSNEERGYVLRRIMRRAILQGRQTLGLGPGFLTAYQDRVTELMGSHYRQLAEHRDTVAKWLASEEENFGRTLEQGSRLLDELIGRAREIGAEGIAAEDAFLLHDTHGFPIDLTLEIAAEAGLGVDEEGFEGLMSQQRRKARETAKFAGVGAARQQAETFARGTGFVSDFCGYAQTAVETTVGAVTETSEGAVLLKLTESPFYATGGGQIADTGTIVCAEGDCRAEVADVLRLGDDQVIAVRVAEGAAPDAGTRVRAIVDPRARHATEANHTATHLLHAALRARLGEHVHQAGSYVGPDKLRFDFNHPAALSAAELADVEDQVNEWILGAFPVRALSTTLTEARALGAMALFGEKYGEIVRMVEVGDGSFSRELCGGTHVRNSAEIGVLRIVSETSSAANVRRIEALTGPAAVALLRAHDRVAVAAARELRVQPDRLAEEAVTLRQKVKTLEKAAEKTAVGAAGHQADLEGLLDGAERIGEYAILVRAVTGVGAALPSLAEALKAKLGAAVVVLAEPGEGKVDLVAAVAPALIDRGISAADLVKSAAAIVGGGGGGRAHAARAGGRDVAKLDEALRVARDQITAQLT